VSGGSTTPLYPPANKTAEACSQGREVTIEIEYSDGSDRARIRPRRYGITTSVTD
jgi:hypothetical protein